MSRTVEGNCEVMIETVELGQPPVDLSPPLAQGALLSERFLVENWVSRGGMGDVYRGRDLRTDAPVAIKSIARFEPEDTKRFVREAAVLATLSHPAIVPYIAHGYTPSGNPFLVMRWLHGRDLAARLAAAPLTAAETWLLVRRVCEGLHVAHTRGVVHRDLKPSNLMLVDDDPAAVTLLDFGVARARGSQPLTRTGAVLGTIGYMAPEQALGELDMDARVDVFALGCLIYECLTGRLAFGARHSVAVLAKVLSAEPPLLADYDKRLAVFDPLLSRLLARDRDARPADASEVLELLDTLRPSIWRLRKLTPTRVQAAVGEQERSVGGALRSRVAAGSVLPEPLFRELESSARKLFGADLEALRLSDAEVVLLVSTCRTGSDMLGKAARFACSLRQQHTQLASALVTSWMPVDGRSMLQELVEQAGKLLDCSASQPGRTLLDARTAELLRPAFELSSADGQALLERPYQADATLKLLMGMRTPCVGRDKELALLLATLAECTTDRVVRSVLVTAEPGMGKSRLLAELLARMEDVSDAPRVISARGDAMAVGSTLALVQQLVMSGLGLKRLASAAERQERCARCFSEPDPFEPRDPSTLFLAELIGAPFAGTQDQQRLLRSARNDPALMSEQKRRAFVRFVLTLSVRSPLLIAIDDLHWGDLASVSYLNDALREAGERAIMLCALARPEVHEQFPGVWSAFERQEVRLPRLTPRAAERLVCAVLGEQAPRETVARIVQLAEGNAFYIEELLRQVALGSHELPESVLAMARARLAQLHPAARRVLRAASAFGERFWLGAVQALLPDVPDLGQELESLARQELLRRSKESRLAGEQEYAFRHALLREAAYATLTDDDRRAAHRCAGEWLCAQNDRDADELSQHFELGGEPLLAAAWLARAARAALDAGDIVRVGALAQRGLALGATGSDRGELLVLRAFACMYTERPETAWIEEALQLIPVGTAFWWLAVSLAIWGAASLGQPEQAKPYIRLALTAPTDAEPCGPHGQAVWLSVIGLISLKQTQLAALILERFQSVAKTGARAAASDLAFEGWIAVARCTPGLTHPWSAAELGGAIEDAERARRSMRECGALVGEVTALAYGAIAMRNIGGYGAAENMLRQADVLFVYAVPRALREIVRINQAWLALRGGRLSAAEPLIRELCGSNDRPLALQALCLEAELHYRRGAFQQALSVALRCTSSGYPTAERWGGATLARTRLALRQPEQALLITRTLLQEEGVGHEADTETDLYVSQALALSALGDEVGARRTLAEVCQRISDTASQFADPHQRALFLYGVEAHARAAQLAAAWSLVIATEHASEVS